MIDNDLRLRRLRQEAADPETGLILMDVVLGEGAHPNPASELAPAIEDLKAQRPELEFVIMVIGTDADPQNMDLQVERFKDAGAIVYRTATEAIEHVAQRMVMHPTRDGVPVLLESLNKPLSAINVGLESFYVSLIGQGGQAVQVDWKPPAGGNEKLAAILAKMKKK
jgi:FdrA protein